MHQIYKARSQNQSLSNNQITLRICQRYLSTLDVCKNLVYLLTHFGVQEEALVICFHVFSNSLEYTGMSSFLFCAIDNFNDVV